MRLITTTLWRSLARPTSTATRSSLLFLRAPTTVSLPLSVARAPTSTHAHTLAGARPFSSTPSSLAVAGSGKGGKKGKDAGDKAKKDKEKEKEKAKKLKEKEKEKERARKEKEKEKERAKKVKAAEKKKREQKVKAKPKPKPKVVTKPRMTSRLTPPKAPMNSWAIFLSRYSAERKAAHNPETDGKFPSVTAIAKDAAPLYRDLSADDKAELLRESETQKAAYPQVLAEWTASLTPDMIREENAIRARRKKLGKSHKKPLRLSGQPKRPPSAYIMWTTKVRNEQGIAGEIMKGETNVLEQSKLLAAAWKSLPADEREAVVQEQKEVMAHYRELKTAFDEELKQRTSA